MNNSFDGLCPECKEEIFTMLAKLCPECKREETNSCFNKCASCAISQNKCSYCDKEIKDEQD